MTDQPPLKPLVIQAREPIRQTVPAQDGHDLGDPSGIAFDTGKDRESHQRLSSDYPSRKRKRPALTLPALQECSGLSLVRLHCQVISIRRPIRNNIVGG